MSTLSHHSLVHIYTHYNVRSHDFSFTHSSQRKKQAAIAVSLLVLIFSAKTVSRNWEWGSTSGIATAALKTNPGNAKIHMSMGNELAQQVCDN